jgi:putative addiction module component (TIGR02574 family)
MHLTFAAPNRTLKAIHSIMISFAPLFKLSRAERLQLVEDLWDSLVQDEAELPVSEEKRDELRRRKERFLQHPSSGETWEQVKHHARTQHD